MFFAKRLTQFMKEKNISQYKLKKMTGVAQSTLSQILSGKQSPTDDTIERILSGLNITRADFYGAPEDNSAIHDLRTKVLERMERMSMTNEEKAAYEYIKKMPPDKQHESFVSAMEKFKSLPVPDQEALIRLINSLSASRR